MMEMGRSSRPPFRVDVGDRLGTAGWFLPSIVTDFIFSAVPCAALLAFRICRVRTGFYPDVF